MRGLINPLWHKALYLVMLASMSLSLSLLSPQQAAADAVGATGAIEIVKLTEMITQITQLLELTEYIIDVQESIEDLQERSLHSKSSSYLLYLQLLGGILGGEAGELSQQLTILVNTNAALRELATRTSNSQQRDGLYLVSDSLRSLIDAAVILETSARALKEASESEDLNYQDQTLSAIHRTLALINSENTRVRYNRNIRSVANENMLFGSFNVFTDR